MKYQELADIALKMFGIYWLVMALMNLTQILVMLPKLDELSSLGLAKATIIGWAVFIILYAALGYVLTFRTGAVMRAIRVGEGGDAALDVSDNIAAYQRLGLMLIGVFFAVPAASALLPQLVKLIAYQKASPGYANMYKDAFLTQEWPGIVEDGIKLIAGTALILGRDRLTALWRRFRPLSEVNEEEEGKGKG